VRLTEMQALNKLMNDESLSCIEHNLTVFDLDEASKLIQAASQ
jgi:hypothetical protein